MSAYRWRKAHLRADGRYCQGHRDWPIIRALWLRRRGVRR